MNPFHLLLNFIIMRSLSLSLGYLNDLWKFDGADWSWMSGSNQVNQYGTYGIEGQANSTNVPGARYAAVSWVDSNNDLWLFGGIGYDSVGLLGEQRHWCSNGN